MDYIDKKEFYKEIIQSKINNRLTKKAEQLLILLANNTIRKMHYLNTNDKKDCLQEGLLILFKNWRCFDETNFDDAFAYYTEIFKRAMARGKNILYNKKMKTISISNFYELEIKTIDLNNIKILNNLT